MDSPSLGLGDTIAKATSAVGIKPCDGCKRRQAWLNRKFPYKQESIMPKTTTPVIPAKIVSDATTVGAAGVHIPPPQTITLGCPHCGAKQITTLQPIPSPGGVTFNATFEFGCGQRWKLRNGNWTQR
jgi:hypothetical protein